MYVLLLSVLLCLLASCGKSPPAGDVDPPSPAENARFTAGSRRLAAFLDFDQVVSRNAAGGPERVGDSLLWTWIAIGTLRCDDGAQMAQSARDKIVHEGGDAYRFIPLPLEYADGDEISVDDEVGIWFGTAARARRCPSEAAELARVWGMRQQAIATHNGRLHPNVARQLPPGWDAARDQVSASLGLGAPPAPARLELLGSELAGWALLVTSGHKACFRLNVAWTVIRALEEAGGIFPETWRNGFCAATVAGDVPTIDHWCGREGLQQYLDAYQPNLWEYRHQRCGAWETPDAGALTTPGLDELVALRQRYGEAL